MKKLVVLLSALLLGGCASLPTGLDIETGPELTSPEQQEIAFFSPAGPSAGASPEEIVNGFIAAGTGPQNDYAVARQYLSENFSTRWRPGGQTLIRVGGYDLNAAGETLQIVSLTIGAKVDEFGRFETVNPTINNLRFRLAQENGEWRITSAPNLTVVTLPVFGVVFSQFPIYFLDSTSTQQVPDLRWFPNRASIATQLVNALLDGPANWLSDSVLSAIPAGTRLQVSAVLIQEGVARVDLDETAIAADDRQRGLLLTQLRSTLLQIPGILDVAVSIAGAEQDIVPAQIAPLPPATTFALSAEGIIRLSGSEAGLIAGTDQIVEDLDPRHLAAGKSGELLSIATLDGVFRLKAAEGDLTTERISSQGLVVDLQIDIFGNTWIFRDGIENQIEVIDSNLQSQLLNIPGGERILSAAVSPEGGRLAVLTSGQTQALEIYGVVRNQQGLPLTLASNFEIEPLANQSVSLTWNQPSFVRVLERNANGAGSISDYPVTGPRVGRTAPPVPGLVIETGFALVDSFMLSENGDVWSLSNNSWRRVQASTLDLSTGR